MVPAQATTWSGSPFTPRTANGWMTGRGTGDMKGGFAMGLLAIEALRAAMPGAVTGELSFLSVIEEECTGNGTLAACQAGALGDAVILLEPTGLDLLLGGVGILWADIGIEGVPAHAESADRAVNPARFVPAILRALDDLATEMSAGPADPAFSEVASPYNVNVGTLSAGDWPSSVPATARLGVRVGYPRGWSPEEALGRVTAAVRSAAAGDPWLARAPAVGPRVGLPGRGLPAERRSPAGHRHVRCAPVGARRGAAPAGHGIHHRRPVLPEPVRPASAGLRAPRARHPRR